MMIDTASDPITMYGVHLLRALALVPIITGSNGKMHGARTVSTPEKKERARNDRVSVSMLQLCHHLLERVGEPGQLLDLIAVSIHDH